jgi:hypothetical protein
VTEHRIHDADAAPFRFMNAFMSRTTVTYLTTLPVRWTMAFMRLTAASSSFIASIVEPDDRGPEIEGLRPEAKDAAPKQKNGGLEAEGWGFLTEKMRS